METDVSHTRGSAQQFWDELHEIVSAPFDTHETIDNTLRAYIDLVTLYKQDYLESDDDLARCCHNLLDSDLFKSNEDYIRRQFVYGLLQEDEAPVLHIAASVLLYDGRSHEETFQMMQTEGLFIRLLELVKSLEDDGSGLHRLLLELLCDMSRIQQLSREDLGMVDDAFILYLFRLIEELSDDASDPYHYPIIRILLVLNEQYMCFAQSPPELAEKSQAPLTNRIIKILSAHGPSYRTFGENLILLLNRESALGPQLLILKLLYLLFTTRSTFEYFYTNDLHVLVDVIIRNLLDLDPSSDDEGGGEGNSGEGGGQRALCHTYLRVLYPLLRNTQLAREGSHYKPEELRKLFYLLVNSSSLHFAPVDDTVVRLVSRCKQVDWLRDESDDAGVDNEQLASATPPTDADMAKKLLGISLLSGGESNLSVLEVAAKVEKERPTLPAPRRRKKKAVHDGEGHSGNGHLRVLPTAVPASSSTAAGQPAGQSPFADEYYE